MTEKSDTTLMMVTYNRLDLTKQTIESLFDVKNHNPMKDFNLVIVDNGSTDGTQEYLMEFAEKVYPEAHGKSLFDGLSYPHMKSLDIVFLDKNKGIAIGRNIALKKAKDMGTKWFCTIDNDVQLPNNWLRDAINILEANKNYCAIGVNFETETFPLVTSNGYTFQEKPSGNLGTACMVFRKQLQQMLGYFNTEYGMYGEEDADFGMRARVAGFRMGYVKENGTHLGADEEEKNEYREFKTKQHADNLALFKQNCGLYYNKKKPIFIPYREYNSGIDIE